MKKTVIVFGGDTCEHDISIVTAFLVKENFVKNKTPHLFVYLGRDGVFYYGAALDKKENYSSLKGFKKGYFKRENKKTYFVKGIKKEEVKDVLLCVHGEGMEDGTLGAFFDILKVPVSYEGVESASIIQNKYLTKLVLSENEIPVTKSLKLDQKTYKNQHFNIEGLLKDFSFPLILKPLHLGSSIGVYKCENNDEINSHLVTLFNLDNEVLIEECITSLKEYNIAVVGDEREVFASLIEEVNREDRVLSFIDKYEEFSSSNEKQIPANIDSSLHQEIEALAIKSFNILKCSGVVRFDFLYDSNNKKLYLNEVNSIPGSLAYYLFEGKGMSFKELIERILDSAKYRMYLKNKKITTYEGSNLLKIGAKK